jgi:polyferredoxin
MKIGKEQARDTGMALVLMLLLLTLAFHRNLFVYMAIAVHVVNMIAPQIYRPVAVVWLGMAHLLGTVMSRVILSVVFFGVVAPIGFWRRLMGADALRLKEFKAKRSSVMEERNHFFTGKDIEQPY